MQTPPGPNTSSQLTLDLLQSGSLLLVNKPKNWSSFDVIKKIRGILRVKKIGHGGTLDPLASGLMLIATGSYTKKLTGLQDLPKEYRGIICIGATRPSFDKETEIEEIWDINQITEKDVYDAASKFKGVIEQVPPAYSAIKIDGKRSYKLARRGQAPEMKARTQEIFEFEIEKIEFPMVYFRVHCSKGTYIRSLANDLGKELGIGAYLEELERTRIGEYLIEDAWPLEDLVTIIMNLKKIAQHEDISGSR